MPGLSYSEDSRVWELSAEKVAWPADTIFRPRADTTAAEAVYENEVQASLIFNIRAFLENEQSGGVFID